MKFVNGVNAAKTVPESGTLTKAKPARIAARNKSTGRSILFPPLTAFHYYMYKDPKMDSKMCQSYKGGGNQLKNRFSFFKCQEALLPTQVVKKSFSSAVAQPDATCRIVAGNSIFVFVAYHGYHPKCP